MEEEFSIETDFQIEKDHVKYNKNQQVKIGTPPR